MKRTLTLAILFLLSYRVFSQTSTDLFFDDFARYNNRLDTTKWLPKSTVYINNHLSHNPVSKNIASFNGLSPNGIFTTNTSGATFGVDTLTSRPINLAGKVAADSVYLNFYVQTGGIGGMPIPSSNFPTYFQVELKSNNGTWVPDLRINPLPTSQRNLNFRKYQVVITDPQFMHGNFQFRFRSFGKNRLTDDTWNLDYVLLGFHRRKSDLRFDVTTSRRVSPLLQRYTAMPIHQFMANIAGELNDSVYTTLNNYEAQPRAFTTYSSIQIGSNAPVSFATHPIAIRPNYLQYDSFPDKPATSIFNNLNGFQTIRSSVFVDTQEKNVEKEFNDSLSRKTELHDYYAYDDGSAESIASYVIVNGGQVGQVAVRFDLNQRDRVKTISVFIPKVGNTKNRVVNFKIWNVAANGAPDGAGIFTQSFTVPDIAQLDNWFHIPVNPSVIVDGAFFVGWSFNGSLPLFSLGHDLNKNTPVLTTESGSSGWVTKNSGTLMLRVAMNNNVTGIAENAMAAAAKTRLFPNPATDHVNIQGNFETVRILNSTGQLVMEKKGNGTEMRLETQTLKPGFYLVQLQKENQIETHKLIIQRN